MNLLMCEFFTIFIRVEKCLAKFSTFHIILYKTVQGAQDTKTSEADGVFLWMEKT
jgi:hypothetical protein